MPVAELIVHAFLLTVAVFMVAAVVATVKEKCKEKWLPSRKETEPPNRKVKPSMSKTTAALRGKEEIEARLAQVSSELAIFKQVNAPQSSIDLMQARVDELAWVLKGAN